MTWQKIIIQRILLIRRRRYRGDRDSIRFPDHHGTWGASSQADTLASQSKIQKVVNSVKVCISFQNELHDQVTLMEYAPAAEIDDRGNKRDFRISYGQSTFCES